MQIKQHSSTQPEHPPCFSNINLIDRNNMSGLSEMMVDGEIRNLGIVKNFKDNDHLKAHLPEDLSISWAHLDPAEKLGTHRHPVASLIIAIEGDGCSQGDSEITFHEGDALVIPPWNEHGFTGLKNGLWALSIQFSDVAIFENEIDPLTTFKDTALTLPSLEERQIQNIHRDGLTTPSTFKSNPVLKNILPDSADFSWFRVESTSVLTLPDEGSKRLIIVSSGKGCLLSQNNTALQPGSMFWQESDIEFSTDAESTLWILLLTTHTKVA